MKTSLIYILAIAILLLPSCDAKGGGAIYSRSYINNYYYTSGKELLLQATVDIKPGYMVLYGKPQILLQRWRQTEEDKILLDSLCLRNNDTHYNNIIAEDLYTMFVAFADNFISMTITSDADWDEKHKAGTPLDDITTVQYVSYREFIDSGYSLQSSLGGKKMLSDLQENDLWILYSLYFEIQSPPTLATEHNLTVTMTSDLGRVYTGKVVYQKK